MTSSILGDPGGDPGGAPGADRGAGGKLERVETTAEGEGAGRKGEGEKRALFCPSPT